MAACQDSRVFGMSAARFDEIIAQKDRAAILALKSEELERPGPRGPAVYYYLARWLEASEGFQTEAATPGPEAEAQAEDSATAAVAAGPEIPPALSGIGAGGALDQVQGGAGDPEARLLELYRLGFERNEGEPRRESGRGLVAALARKAARLGESAAAAQTPRAASAAAWTAVLDTSQTVGEKIGPDWKLRRPRLDALDALDRDAELYRELADIRSLFPSEAAKDSDALQYFESKALHGLGKKGWREGIRGLLLDRPSSEWTSKALDFALSLEPGQGGFSAEEIDAARMRLAVKERDYGPAYRYAQGALDLVLAPEASKSLVSDAGKAFLYSGSSAAGIERFRAAYGPAGQIAELRSGAAREAAWTGAFYRARFLRALKRWDEATSLYEAILGTAPSAEDQDGARWYLIDCKIQQAESEAAAAAKRKDKKKKPTATVLEARAASARRTKLAIIAGQAPKWKDPAHFDDLAEPLFREGIQARDWSFVEDFARKLGPSLSPVLGARSLYVAGRAAELGWTGREGAEKTIAADLVGAADFYHAVLALPGASTYYRILAARRLNEDLALIPPDMGPPPDSRPGELEAFLSGFIDCGMGDLAFSEAKERFPELDLEAMRRLASALSRAGRYADSMRTVLFLMDRQAWDPRRSDYELLYPRAYLVAVRSVGNAVPEHLLYGLLRSESFFRPDVVSSAGAIGLAQLMPATAAELARGLGMTSYNLKNPSDNLRLGSRNFAELIDETGGRPLRAMFAYNAGRGRLRRWLSDGEGLPDDILLESLSIEETRQYGRNILQASVMYGELYNGMKAASIVDEIMGESGALAKAGEESGGAGN
jgi:soluble lytic murein transglycosylase-like protein